MPTVVTSVTTTNTPFRWQTPTRVDQTGIPTGEVRCTAADTIDAPGAGNNQLLVVATSLPSDRAYVLMDYALRIVTGTAGTFNFDAGGEFEFLSAASNADNRFYSGVRSNGQVFSTNTPLESRMYRLLNIPRMLMYPSAVGSQVSANTRVFNETADDVAYTFVFWARYLEFEVSQYYDWTANAPIAVR